MSDETNEEIKRAKAFQEVFDEMQNHGLECGIKIMEIAKKINPEHLFAFPLYRGCILIPKQHNQDVLAGDIMIYMYHDPHWLGHELNEETLPKFMNTLIIGGQRSGQDYSLNGSEMDVKDMYKSLPYLNIIISARNIANERGFGNDITEEDWEECVKEAFIQSFRKNEEEC